MIAKEHKLNSVEFKKVFDQGAHIHTDHLFIKYLVDQTSFKTAAVVSKKQSKTAIKRNYKRRHVYNALAQVYTESDGVYDGVWTIVMLKKTSISAPYVEIVTDCQKAFAKIPN